jgi:hypothetical protein
VAGQETAGESRWAVTQNTLHAWPEIIGIVAGAVVLLVFALTFALPARSRTKPASKGHRDEAGDGNHEDVRPDGYIDSFSGEIEEAGGGLPWVVIVAVVGVLLFWVVYIVVRWTP